jgi:hypothetical protein
VAASRNASISSEEHSILNLTFAGIAFFVDFFCLIAMALDVPQGVDYVKIYSNPGKTNLDWAYGKPEHFRRLARALDDDKR